jgi:hypothetical protein
LTFNCSTMTMTKTDFAQGNKKLLKLFTWRWNFIFMITSFQASLSWVNSIELN